MRFNDNQIIIGPIRSEAQRRLQSVGRVVIGDLLHQRTTGAIPNGQYRIEIAANRIHINNRTGRGPG